MRAVGLRFVPGIWWLGLLVGVVAGCNRSAPQLETAPDNRAQGASGNRGAPEQSPEPQDSANEIRGFIADLGAVRRLQQAECILYSPERAPLGLSLVFLVDASASALEHAKGSGGHTKWDVMQKSLGAALELPPPAANLGLLVFPNQSASNERVCFDFYTLLSPTPLAQSVDAFRQTLAEATVGGCAPTHDAYQLAAEARPTNESLGRKTIILLTDGPPTLDVDCAPGDCALGDLGAEARNAIVDAIATQYAEANVQTAVIGLPGSEGSDEDGSDRRLWLSAAARQGGLADPECQDQPPFCHFDLSAAADLPVALDQTLRTIVERIDGCDFNAPSFAFGTPAADEINLVLYLRDSDPVLLLRQPDDRCKEGWYFDRAAGRPRLCGDTCQTTRQDPKAELEWLVGCASVGVEE